MTKEQRRSPENGIWLCQSCAKLVDNDEIRYPVEFLKRWKNLAEEIQRMRIEGRKRKRGSSRVPDLQEEMVKVSCPTCGKKVEGCLGNLPMSSNGFVCRKCGSFHVHRDPDGAIFTRKPGGTLKGITVTCPKCQNQLRVRVDKKKFFKNCLDCESILRINNGNVSLVGPMNAVLAAAFSKKGWQQLLACPNCRGINGVTLGENNKHILFAQCPKCRTNLKFAAPAKQGKQTVSEADHRK